MSSQEGRQPSGKRHILERTVALYRSSFKRSPYLHRAMYSAGCAVSARIARTTGFATRDSDPLVFRLSTQLGFYEYETVSHFRNILRPGAVVLDIGAHVGYYARLFARLTGPTGAVFAFEPHPVTFDFLEENLAGYRNTKCLQLAIGQDEGFAELRDELVETGSASLFRQLAEPVHEAKELAPRIAREFAAESFPVAVTSLDALLAAGTIDRPDVIKLDVEGAEYSVLSGMSTIMNGTDRIDIVLEFNPRALDAAGVTPSALFGLLWQHGFETRLLDRTYQYRHIASNESLADLVRAMQTHSCGYVNVACAR